MKAKNDSTAIVRMERLYPIPLEELRAELSRYPSDAELVWVQEEPSNQGAWPRMALTLPELLGRPLSVVALPASSAPAPGSAKVHAATHREIVETAIPAEG
jgi:2-oxoglutarate dehydrogenase E1 component